MMNVERLVQHFILLSCVLYAVSAECRPCFMHFYKTACENDFAMVAKVTNVSSSGLGRSAVIHYQLGFNTVYIYKLGTGFLNAEKIMRSKFPNGANCDVPDTEFLVGHYYVLMGRVITDGSRKLLEVKRCNYMDFEDIANNSNAISNLSELKKHKYCPSGKGKWKTGTMNNAFVKGGRK